MGATSDFVRVDLVRMANMSRGGSRHSKCRPDSFRARVFFPLTILFAAIAALYILERSVFGRTKQSS